MKCEWLGAQALGGCITIVFVSTFCNVISMSSQQNNTMQAVFPFAKFTKSFSKHNQQSFLRHTK